MKTYVMIVLILFTTSLIADLSYFERDVNAAQLEQCKAFFINGKDVKTIHLLNGQTLEFKDEYLNNDPEYKILLYTLKGCFFREKYLIYSDFMPDSEAYHALDLHDGTDTLLEGMPYPSPKQHFFTTKAEESNTLSIYTFKEDKIITVFTKHYPEHCLVQHPLWINDTTLSFVLSCERLFDSDTNTTKAATKEVFWAIQKEFKWEITQP